MLKIEGTKAKIVEKMNFSDERFLSAVRMIRDVVGSTYGPGGRLVTFSGNLAYPTYTKDGVSVARQIAVKDPFANHFLDTLIQAADQQLRTCGDGTTLSIILAAEIILNSHDLIADQSGISRNGMKKLIEKTTEEICQRVIKSSLPANDKDLENIVSVALNNDDSLKDVVLEAVTHCGAYGGIAKHFSPDGRTRVVFEAGYQWESGILECFANQPGQNIADDPYVLVCNDALIHEDDLMPIVIDIRKEAAIRMQCEYAVLKSINIPTLFVIAPNCERSAMGVIKKLRTEDILNVVWVTPGGNAGTVDRMYQTENIAAFTGATAICGDSPINKNSVRVKHLGRCNKILATTRAISLIGGNPDTIEKRIQSLIAIKKNFEGKFKSESKYIDDSIARLRCKFADILIGGNSEAEMKERIDRVDDALRSVASAREMGVVSGGGVTLYQSAISDKLNPVSTAAMVPARKIMENAGIPEFEIKQNLIGIGEWVANSYDYKTGTIFSESFMEKNIIDPCKTIVYALKNAASVAKTILDTAYVLIDED